MSPQCDWDWKSSPKPWVNELVAALRAASFVDHKCVYLTGCSMGGMGVWEVEDLDRRASFGNIVCGPYRAKTYIS